MVSMRYNFFTSKLHLRFYPLSQLENLRERANEQIPVAANLTEWEKIMKETETRLDSLTRTTSSGSKSEVECGKAEVLTTFQRLIANATRDMAESVDEYYGDGDSANFDEFKLMISKVSYAVNAKGTWHSTKH